LAAATIPSYLSGMVESKMMTAREATAFTGQKDLPTADAYALKFPRTRPEFTSESVSCPIRRDSLQTTEADEGSWQ
jgi:hypothetical protein